MKVGLVTKAFLLTCAAMLIAATIHYLIYAQDIERGGFFGSRVQEFVRINALIAIAVCAVAGLVYGRMRGFETDSEFMISAIVGVVLTIVVTYVLEYMSMPRGATRTGFIAFSYVGLAYVESFRTWNLVATFGSAAAFCAAALVFVLRKSKTT